MNTQEMGDAIAQACEWTHDHNPESDCLYRTKDGRGMLNPAVCLNAMHEAVASLPFSEQHAFSVILAGMLWLPSNTRGWEDWRDTFVVSEATATQRAEAFLKTKGLWKEGI